MIKNRKLIFINMILISCFVCFLTQFSLVSAEENCETEIELTESVSDDTLDVNTYVVINDTNDNINNIEKYNIYDPSGQNLLASTEDFSPDMTDWSFLNCDSCYFIVTEELREQCFIWFPSSSGDYIIYDELIKLSGDMDEDGVISDSDITILNDYLLSRKEFDIKEFLTADVTRDGHINVFDSVLLRRLYGERSEPDEPVFEDKDQYVGIDVSRWQGSIDWEKVKADNIDFAIIRAGYGRLASQKDVYFDENIVNAQAAGMDCGVYWYSYATTPEEAIEEAEACYEVIKDYKLSYPVAFDIEDSSQVNLSNDVINEIIYNFCSTLEDKGYYVSVYSYAYFLNTKLSAENLKRYDIWVAHYGVDEPSFDGKYGMWQYTSSGNVNGIDGNVDMNIAYKNYPHIMYTYKKNNCG